MVELAGWAGTLGARPQTTPSQEERVASSLDSRGKVGKGQPRNVSFQGADKGAFPLSAPFYKDLPGRALPGSVQGRARLKRDSKRTRSKGLEKRPKSPPKT